MTLMFGDPERAAAKPLVTMALREDYGRDGDVTSQAFLPADLQGSVQLVARQPGVLAGFPLAGMLFAAFDPKVQITQHIADGAPLVRGDVVAEFSGPVRSLLAGERSVLNFVSYLSGIATAARRYTEAVSGTRARIYDTRKTLPGWRVLAKYAVRAGGAQNHRMGLHDAVLIKDNHLACWKASGAGHTVAAAVTAARAAVPPGMVVEVEVDTLEQLADALTARPDIVLLDNMSLDLLRAAVALRDGSAPGVELEASGGVTLETLAGIAATGVERISSGALTHSVTALDLAFDWAPAR